MSPKDRVRGNIYKDLFSAEKQKNKKLVWTSFGLFVFGIIGGSTYQSIKEMEKPVVMATLSSKWERMLNYKDNDYAKMRLPDIKIDKISFVNGISKDSEDNITLDHILNGEIFEETELLKEISTDNLYNLDDA
ncbi:MAG: hypothetical protein LBT51_08145 [Fusobacteriaceae bacterium]|jgi:hypothetical protein|nr:hypothetical protein [Fusobacteriaceae bacterium]